MEKLRATSTRSQTEQQLAERNRWARHGLAIDTFSSDPATGVWYYRVDVSVHEQELQSTFVDSDDSSSEDDRSSDTEPLTDVEQYSILRRYNDFLQLYEQIRKIVIATEGNASSLPPFPVKEIISPAWAGLFWRVSSSKTVLEERRTKFETLLQWIESHPSARSCSAFVKFLGKPPQTQDGYVSLKEYTSPDWLSSLQQVTQGVEERKRRYSAGSSAIHSMLERPNSEASGALMHSRRQRLEVVMKTPPTHFLGKRQYRSAHWIRRVEPPLKKASRTVRTGDSNTQKLTTADQVYPSAVSRGKRKLLKWKATPVRSSASRDSVSEEP